MWHSTCQRPKGPRPELRRVAPRRRCAAPWRMSKKVERKVPSQGSRRSGGQGVPVGKDLALDLSAAEGSPPRTAPLRASPPLRGSLATVKKSREESSFAREPPLRALPPLCASPPLCGSLANVKKKVQRKVP